MARTIFIGDVHGCLEELRELVEEKIRPVPGDRIIMLGDLINKGPDSVGVVKYAFSRGFECLMGNHELHYSHKFAAAPRYGAYRAALTDPEHAWLTGLPYFIEDENFIAVHAGLLAKMSAQETHASENGTKTITSIRHNQPRGGWSSANHQPGGTPWWERYQGAKPVFYGHWASQGLALNRNNTYGLDTGCVYGKFLSAYCLETGELLQVAAKKAYVEIGE